MKTVTIPFDLEMARKIQNGEVEGKIVDDYKTEYEIIKYDAKGIFPLIGVYFNEETSSSFTRSFTIEGRYSGGCPSYDLQLKLPWYLTYEDGQYVTMESRDINYVLIYKSYVKGEANPVNYHVLFNMVDKELYFDSCCDDKVLVKAIRPSLTSEIELMHDLLRENGKRWNPETKQVEDVEKKPAHEFKPWDLCLARFKDTEPWCPVQFGYINNINVMISVGGLGWNKWIPYEGNEHLLGMINDPE